MDKKTLDELRRLARAAGLRGYSGLRKKQLIELLTKQKASSPAASTPKAAKPTPARGKSALRTTTVRQPAQKTVPQVPAATAASAEHLANTEQHIESAKFEMAPPGSGHVSSASIAVSIAPDLHEDIETLPAPSESVLCLLPQKPGVVHAYWALQSGAPIKELRLRLCRMSGNAIELMSEIEIANSRGHWYFQVGESQQPGSLVAQLGSYDASGAFVTAIRRGVARIPSLYASAQTDRRWWISDDEFREMYVRAGGVTRGEQLLWPGSFSSRQR